VQQTRNPPQHPPTPTVSDLDATHHSAHPKEGQCTIYARTYLTGIEPHNRYDAGADDLPSPFVACVVDYDPATGVLLNAPALVERLVGAGALPAPYRAAAHRFTYLCWDFRETTSDIEVAARLSLLFDTQCCVLIVDESDEHLGATAQLRGLNE
jgi:hypothetical protein